MTISNKKGEIASFNCSTLFGKFIFTCTVVGFYVIAGNKLAKKLAKNIVIKKETSKDEQN